ncbi:MAG: phosphatase PAP2 family protein [Mogibacterium sp.]|nr:phosphatase PAP2 family protein [Mogibacterium sp.]
MKKVIGAFITGVLFAALIVLLKIYDVAAIGPMGTEIGFSHFNQFIHELTGVNMLWYDITDYIGYAAIGVCVLFACVGFVQMVKRRSLIKVDKEILALGGLFVVVIGCYVFFKKYIINYRPIIMPGEDMPEASFPSSHTMLIMTVFIAVMIISDRYVNKGLGALVRLACFLIVLVTIGGRLYCGVHWCTDIIGGILLTATLLMLFSAVVSSGSKKLRKADLAFEAEGRTERPKKTGGSMSGYKPKH